MAHRFGVKDAHAPAQASARQGKAAARTNAAAVDQGDQLP
jgi:hypothetical protein